MLKLQYFGHLIWRTDSLKNTLMLGKTEGDRKRWLDGITDSVSSVWASFGKMVKDREAWRAAVHGATKTWTWLSDGTAITIIWTLQLSSQRSQRMPFLSFVWWGPGLHGQFGMDTNQRSWAVPSSPGHGRLARPSVLLQSGRLCTFISLWTWMCACIIFLRYLSARQ